MALGIKMQLINKKELEQEYSSYLDRLSKKYNLNVKINSTINEQMKQTEQHTKNTTKAQNDQNKSLQQLIQLRKTLQIDAQQFTQIASKYRQEEEFVNLTKKEQVQLVTMLTKAEKEHTSVLNSRTNILKTMNNQEEQLAQAMAKGREASQLKTKVNDRNSELLQAKAINQALEKTKQLEIDISLYKQKMLGGNGFTGELDIFADKQKGKYDKDALTKIRTDIDGLNASTPELNTKIKQTGIEFSSLRQQAAQSGNVMTRALENAGKFLRFYMVGGLLVSAVNALKGSINVVRELDTSLTELNKVSDLTSQQLESFTNRAFEASKLLGRTGKEIIDATTEFKRAGYNLEESFNLSQQGLLLTNIGDGIKDVKEASSSLISILKGFKMEAQDTAHVVDALNETSNLYAVDTNNLTEILKRVSGVMGQTGTSYEELLGLATGGFEVLRNAEMVASGLNTISQRLRGMSDEGEKVVDLVPKIQSAFDKYTNGAVSVIDKQNGGLHSTFEILQQLSTVYPTLSDEAKAYLNEAVAGNRQNKVLVSIMENWKNVEAATLSASNSLGSADKENEKYLRSINGRISLFTSAMQLMWKNTINSEFIKFFVDFGTLLVGIVDKLGFLNVAIVATTVSLLLFHKGFLAFYSTNIASMFIGLGNAFVGLAIKMGIATASATLLGTALTMIAPFAIVAVLAGVIAAFNHFNVTIDEQREKVQALSTELQNLKSEYENLLQKDTRTDREQKYLDILEKEIENQKALLALETLRLVQRQYMNNSTGNQPTKTFRGYAIANNEKGNATNEINKDIAELQKYNEQILKLDENNKTSGKSYDDLSLKIANKTDKLIQDRKEIEDNIKNLEDYNKQGSEEYKVLTNLANAIDEVILKNNEVADSADKAGDSIEEAFDFSSAEASIKTLQKVKEETKDLTDAMAEYDDAGKFNNTTILELISKYPDLIKYLGSEKELYEQITKKIKDKTTETQTAFNNDLKLLETSINQKAKGYVTDLQNWKSIEEAKLAISKDMLNQVNDMYNKTLNATGDEGTAEISAMKFARRLKESLDASLPDISNYIDLKNFNVGKLLQPDSSGSKSSSTSSEKEISDTILKADRYAELNTQLEITNSLLEKNKAIQENLSGKALISSLREEQELYEQKQKNLSAINDERRKERAELTSYLKTQGAVFKGEGDLLQVKNAQVILQNKLDEVNAHRSDKNKTLYNQLKSQYDNLNDSLKRFIDLQTKDIPNASAEWWKLEGAIKDSTSTIEDNIKAQIQLQLEAQQKIDELVLKDKHDREQTAFDIQKKIDDEAFSVKQQGEKDNFEAIKKIRDDAFSEQLQQKQDNFDKQKKIEDETFSDKQQGEQDIFDAQKKIRDESFSAQQQQEQDNFDAIKKIEDETFSDKQQGEQDIFDAQKKIRDESFSAQQQAEQDNFDAIKKIDDKAFSAKLQAEQDIFDAQKKLDDKAFEDSQQRQKTNLSAQTYGVTESDYNNYKANKIAQLDQDIVGLQGVSGADSEIQAKQTEINNLNAQSFSDLTDYQQLYTDIHQVRIDALDAELTALQATNEAQAETETRLKNQNDLIEKQTALKNALDNKNVQQLKKQSDGSWQYEYVADADAVESAQKAVADQITSNQEWESQTTLKHKEDLLNQEKQYEQDLIDAKNELSDTLQTNLDKSLVEEKITYDDSYTAKQKALDASLQLEQEIYDNAYTLRQKALDTVLKLEQDTYDLAETTRQRSESEALKLEQEVYDNAYAVRQKALDTSLKARQDVYDKSELTKQKALDNALKAEQLIYDNAEIIKQATLTNAQNVENLILTTHYADMNTLVDAGLKELEKTYGNDWDKINETIKSKLDIAKARYAELALIQAETGSLESADVSGGNSPTNVKTPQQLYAEARANGDWQGMEDANRQANIEKGVGNVITATKDIEAVKNAGRTNSGSSSMDFTDGLSQTEKDYLVDSGKTAQYSGQSWSDIEKKLKDGTIKFESGGENSKTGLQWLDGTLSKPERVLSAEQTLSFNKLVANLPNLMNLIKLPSLLDFSSFKSGSNSKTEQIFNIDKLEFPNVTNHTEIVQALDTISSRAKQYSTTKIYGLNQ